MNTNHTPGPWLINVTDAAIKKYKNSILITGGKNGSSGVALVKYISILKGPFSEIVTETHANAFIISAAPELLEALEKLLPMAEHWINENHPHHRRAVAAIKKARGL